MRRDIPYTNLTNGHGRCCLARVDFGSLTRRTGRAVRRLRENLKLSQRELGKRAVLGQSTLSKIERGEIAMSADVLFRVSTALEVRPWALLAAADAEDDSPYAGQLTVMATVLAWAAQEPGQWAILRELLESARQRPAVLEMLRLMMMKTTKETLD